MDRRTATDIKRILKSCFLALRSNRNNDAAWVNEDRADRELVSYTQKTMRDDLAKARSKGRSGWWREDQCTIEHLQDLLQEAIQNDDMPNVIVYAAMIEVRRITDE